MPMVSLKDVKDCKRDMGWFVPGRDRGKTSLIYISVYGRTTEENTVNNGCI